MAKETKPKDVETITPNGRNDNSNSNA